MDKSDVGRPIELPIAFVTREMTAEEHLSVFHTEETQLFDGLCISHCNN